MARENSTYRPVYMIGHSGGGQFVTRYMLLRQAIPDSIPIVMAVSSNPYYYTFCTDSFDTIRMEYPCGLSGSDMDIISDNHIKGYYATNYALLNGTADTIDTPGTNCKAKQGANRYQRGLNFYSFSKTDAIKRNTPFNWKYREVEGIGHNEYGMYITNEKPSDTVSIAENLLFFTFSTGIETLKQESDNNLSVYPSPAKKGTDLTIKINAKENGAEIFIFDILGRKIQTLSVINKNEIKISTSGLCAGMYIYNIKSKDKFIRKGKFIIE